MPRILSCAGLSLALLSTSNLVLRAQDEAVAEPTQPVVEAVAEPVAEAVAEPTASGCKTPTLRPLTVTTGLTDGMLITGTLLDTSSIAVKTAFGEASIPLSEVAGIRFPAAEDTSTTIVMLNGDSITGATDVKFVNVETSWGNAKINGQSVSTMLFVPGLTWHNSDSLGGKRWTLTDQKAIPPQTANALNPLGAPQNGQSVPGRVPPGFPNAQPQVIFGR